MTASSVSSSGTLNTCAVARQSRMLICSPATVVGMGRARLYGGYTLSRAAMDSISYVPPAIGAALGYISV